MRKLLLILLLLSNCAAVVEAAIDYHDHAGAGGDTVLTDDPDSHEERGCDHCCHLAGHLLGLIAEIDPLSGYGTASVWLPITAIQVSRATAPPKPPPNS